MSCRFCLRKLRITRTFYDMQDTHPGHYLRAERLRGDLKLQDVAALAGVSESHLSRIERGQRPVDTGLVALIANAIGQLAADAKRDGAA